MDKSLNVEPIKVEVWLNSVEYVISLDKVLVINASDVVPSLTVVDLPGLVINSEVDDEWVIDSSEVWLVDNPKEDVTDVKSVGKKISGKVDILISFANVLVNEVK